MSNERVGSPVARDRETRFTRWDLLHTGLNAAFFGYFVSIYGTSLWKDYVASLKVDINPNGKRFDLLKSYPRLPRMEGLIPSSLPFFNRPASGAVAQLSRKSRFLVHAGTFVHTPDQLLPNLDAFYKADRLEAIYAPEIYKWNKLFHDMWKKTGVPANIQAMIVSIESGGIETAESGDALGLFQVTPENIEIHTGVTSREQCFDPVINARAALAEYKLCYTQAKRTLPGMSEAYYHYRALMAYNGGQVGTGVERKSDKNGKVVRGILPDAEDDQIPAESKNYGAIAKVMMLSAQIADTLRRQGFSDTEVTGMLASPEIYARSEALRTAHNKLSSLFSAPGQRGEYYQRFRLIRDKLALPVVAFSSNDSQYANDAMRAYYAYLADTGEEAWQPTSPGLESRLARGGWAEYLKGSRNLDPEAWRKIDSRKMEPYTTKSDAPEKPAAAESKIKVYEFSQLDPQWGIDHNGWSKDATCGPTTVAMILKSFGVNTNPKEVDKEFLRLGIRRSFADNNGDTYIRVDGKNGTGGAVDWLRKRQYEVIQLHDEQNSAKQQTNLKLMEKMITQGYLILTGAALRDEWGIPRGDPNWPVQHVFVIKGVDAGKGTFLVADPYPTYDDSDRKTKQARTRTLDQVYRLQYAYAVKPR